MTQLPTETKGKGATVVTGRSAARHDGYNLVLVWAPVPGHLHTVSSKACYNPESFMSMLKIKELTADLR